MIRNPQQYEGLRVDYAFKNEDIQNYVNSNQQYKPVCSESEDTLSLSVTFPKEFLQKLEMGNVTDATTGEILKDLSGTITVSHPTVLDLEFESYDFSLMVDTAPERIKGAMFQANPSPVNADKTSNFDAKYVVCFNILKMAGTVHNSDTHNLYIGNNHWTFEGNFTNITPVNVESGCELKTSYANTLYNLDGTASTFVNNHEGYLPLYFVTDINYSSEVVKYEIKIEDDYGLYKKTVVSSDADELQKPKFSTLRACSVKGNKDENGNLNQADNERYNTNPDNEQFALVISHEGDTFKIDEDGVEQPGNRCPENPYVEYKVYQTGKAKPIASGSKQAPVTVNLESGKDYWVEAYAYYSGKIDSKTQSSMKIDVKRSNTYYVSANVPQNSPIANGSKERPYGTVNECFNSEELQKDWFGVTTNPCTINLLTDISKTGDSVIFIPSDNCLENRELAIQGYNKVCSVICNKDDSEYPAISIKDTPSMTIKLKNLLVTSEYGSGIDINTTYGTNIELENVTVKDCVSSDDGGGISMNSTGGSLLLDNCTIENNSVVSGKKGAGIYYLRDQLKLKNKVVINNNYSGTDSTKTNSNLYLIKDSGVQNVINFDGTLSSGSRIGISLESAVTSAVPVSFTSGYSASFAPSAVFFSDAGYAVSWNNPGTQTGEATLYVSAGEISDSLSDISITFATTDEYFIPGKAKTLTVRPTLKISGTEQTASTYTNKIGWKTWFTCDGKQIGSANTGTGSTITYTVPASVIYPDIYMLHVQAWYNLDSNHKSQIFDDEFRIITPSEVRNLENAPVDGTWTISGANDIRDIKSWCNSGNDLSNVVFKMTNNIVTTGSYLGIGTSANPFTGTFDGNGYCISLSSEWNNSGRNSVFSYIKGATIKNLTVGGDSINGTGPGIAGIVYCADAGDKWNYIENCVNNINISCTLTNVGGIVAYAKKVKIKNCVNNGAITSTQNTAGASNGVVGGIVGMVDSDAQLVIENCVNNGTVTTTAVNSANAGGIIGCNINGTGTSIINSVSIGTLQGVSNTNPLSQIVSNLNNWIDSQPNKTDYKKWKVEGDKIVFSE